MIQVRIRGLFYKCRKQFAAFTVHIGDNSVIGAGSVVTKDIPADCVAAGNPCRVIRPINENDEKFYYKDRPITQEDLADEAKLRS